MAADLWGKGASQFEGSAGATGIEDGRRDVCSLRWSQESTQFHKRPSPSPDLKMHGLGYPPDGGTTVNGDVRSNGVKLNCITHHNNGSQGTPGKAMRWSPQASGELRLHSDLLRDLDVQGLLRLPNGGGNDLCLQVEEMKALQNHLQWQNGTTVTTNGAKHLAELMDDQWNGPANGVKGNGWLEHEAGAPRINGRSHPIRQNGMHLKEELSDAMKTLNHHVEGWAYDMQRANGHTQPPVVPSGEDLQGALHSPTSNQGDSPKETQNNRRWVEPPRPVNGALGSLQKRSITQLCNGIREDGQEDDEGQQDPLEWIDDGIKLCTDVHKLVDANRGKAPVPPRSLGAIMGCDPQGEDALPSPLCWSQQAFDEIVLDGDKAPSLKSPPSTLGESSSESSKDGHATTVSADDLKQQLQWSRHIIYDLTRENEDMRHQIEESETREKKWRAEKQRLNKEMRFQRDSITTLRDANAHLVNEVAELRSMGDHLLAQIKQKMKNGTLPKRMGTQ
eukprot:GGOE01021051.1.p1 GENE.GGOE01021051.1~~GGOE01021051.1.p1  ORF type:complete len:592 (-),score=136.34 GGOE01021051.1:1008-2522(-)